MVLIGPFSRNGKSRVIVRAADHDFKPDGKLIPVGILLPKYNEVYLYFTASRVTSDFIADCLRDFWLTVRTRFPHVRTLLINQDNGPENHSRRTQFMKRITEFVDEFQVTIQLAHYPPYHSKYNPIERCWGILEQHWNGAQLRDAETMLQWAKSMTWKGLHPIVELSRTVYAKGVALTKKAMRAVEARLLRNPKLPKWDILIRPACLV